ncbi:MAG: thioesterase family protein [Thermodesulfobacteriota bacterium]|nr:thioesterase family protein [Thermodesulfobacteriota bacterium]
MPVEYVYEHVVTPRDATTSGIAYDGSYIEWACTARERMMVDHLDMSEAPSPWFLVGETYVRYMTPAYLNDRIEIRVVVGDHHVEKGYAKLDLRFSNKATGQLVAQGYQIIFFYDSKTGKRAPISEEFRKLL